MSTSLKARCSCTAALFFFLATAALALKDGEYIQTARKAQFHEQRTHWHDLLGRHCPRFGHRRIVALPLPKPTHFLTETDDYKIQLSFDGDRHVTSWLKVLGKGAPSTPVVEVTLRRSGEELLGVSAQVMEAPVHYQHEHMNLVREFKNVSSWPKHLLVVYKYDTQNEVDLNRGLAVLFILGLLATFILAGSALAGAGPKLAVFLKEMTAEDEDASEIVVGRAGGPKAE